MNESETLRAFTEACARLLEQHMGQIRRCAALLSDEHAWSRTNRHCNSVANLVLHLTGNVRQWILSGVGGEPFDRDRPAEFAARGPGPLAPLVDELERTVGRATRIIRTLKPRDLAQQRSIQGYDVQTVVAAFHAAEHFSFHAGQIIHITKALCDVDLSLYDAQGRRKGRPDGQPWQTDA